MASNFGAQTLLISVLLFAIVSMPAFLNCEELSHAENIWPSTSIAPSVMIAILVRNKAHTLPFFLNHLEKLDYPKERIKLWIRSDHNVDKSVSIMREWLGQVYNKYSSVDFSDDNSETSYSDAEGPFDWSKKRVKNILRLRQDALNNARNSWADYLLFIDCDNFLLNNQTLKILIGHGKPIVAPLLNVTASEHYSNFWGAMGKDGYYRRSKDYAEIRNREKLGVFRVPVVHSTFLVEIRSPSTKGLAYDPPPVDYEGPTDDIIIFARSAEEEGVPMFVSNDHDYGLMLLPMEAQHTLDQEREQFVHMKMECVVFDVPLEKLPYVHLPARTPDKIGFDEVYMINLVRRPDRRAKMMACFRELGINATVVDAVDGKLLNQSYLKSLNVKVASSYADPFHGTRTMTLGEIGCFLSHYFIWLDKSHFNSRNLVAISSRPLLIETTLYTGEPGYFTDTEESSTLDELIPNKASRRGDMGELPSLDGQKVEL